MKKTAAEIADEVLVKVSTVNRITKMYRRALQMLREGTHEYHGTRHLPEILSEGKLVPGGGMLEGNRGVYWARSKPAQGYLETTGRTREGWLFPRRVDRSAEGFITPSSKLQRLDAKTLNTPPESWVSKPEVYSTVDEFVPGVGDYLITNAETPRRIALDALRTFRQQHRLRPMLAEVLTYARTGRKLPESSWYLSDLKKSI